ncbi:unnamed protein product [Pseudo-nitzschia multistriata]|uniref:Uncharacterized protein n=1 Tax=Pseudo-nitzschia multistriata TaxID=183589 RepID=A0A448ZRR0_9STRA|nr:unnamed protein product [Pseudo-nitzschia multistriata]
MRGQAFGLRWQNRRKSKDIGPWGKTTRLHCINPGQTPLVGVVKSPLRTSSRKARERCNTSCNRGAPCQSRLLFLLLQPFLARSLSWSSCGDAWTSQEPSAGKASINGSWFCGKGSVVGGLNACCTSRMSTLLLFDEREGPILILPTARCKSSSSDCVNVLAGDPSWG